VAILALVHFLHLLFGLLWIGGLAVFAIAWYPLLAELPPERGGALQAAIGRRVGPAMAVAGTAVMVTGLLRAWLGGGVTEIADLAAPYGLLVLLSLAIVIAHAIVGGRERRAVDTAMKLPEADAAPALRALVRRIRSTTAIAALSVLAIMAMLGLGMY
jgi:putative copper export protein